MRPTAVLGYLAVGWSVLACATPATAGRRFVARVSSTNPGIHRALLPTPDAGIVAVGDEESHGLVYERDADANVRWVRLESSLRNVLLREVARSTDGAFAAAGQVQGPTDDEDFVLIKFASDGTPLWARSLQALGHDELHALCATIDGGFVAAGSCGSTIQGNTYAVWIARFQSDGSLAWEHSFGGTASSPIFGRAWACTELTDGRLVIVGQAARVWTLSPTGDLIASRVLRPVVTSDPLVEDLTDVVALPDGGYAFTGSVTAAGQSDALIVRVAADESLTWVKIARDDLGASSKAKCLEVTADGGFVVLDDRDEGSVKGLHLLGLDGGGALGWNREHSEPQPHFISDLEIASDGDILFTAGYNGSGPPEGRTLLGRVSPEGLLPDGCPQLRELTTSLDSQAMTWADRPIELLAVDESLVAPRWIDAATSLTITPTCRESYCPPMSVSVTSLPPRACDGASIELSANVAGGFPPMTVVWDLDGDASPDASGSTITVTPSGVDLVATATARDSCSDLDPQVAEDTIVVPVGAAPSVDIVASRPSSWCPQWLDPLILTAATSADSIMWLRNGLPIPGETTATLVVPGPGTYVARVADRAGCTRDAAPVDVVVSPCPPDEVSNVLSGMPPLLLTAHVDAVTFAREPVATSYNVYTGSIGSWQAGAPVAGGSCSVLTARDRGDGTLLLQWTLALNEWILITASNDAGEGTPGLASSGMDRRRIVPWVECGPTR